MLLEDLPADQEGRGALGEIRAAAARSADLTRQLLAFARKQTITPRVIDLNGKVEELLQMLGRLIGEDIELAWRPAAGLEPVHIDPGQVDQVLTNLVVNACDAIDQGPGRITIETGMTELDRARCAAHPDALPGRYVTLGVSDDGCGMDRETRARIFEPFFTTKEVGQGTGLGLATVFGIVKQNEGLIEVESEPGRGTTFRLHLPPHAAGPAGRTAGEEGAGRPARGGETVLVVEDEPAILEMTRSMLARLGYRALAAATPGAALRLAREERGAIHLLLTDVVMPEMNGRQLARSILAIHPDLKRLFMSGYTADVIAHQGVVEEGMNFIQKPFTIAELGERVRRALDEG
jgi:CheY-like chemotaxis protein